MRRARSARTAGRPGHPALALSPVMRLLNSAKLGVVLAVLIAQFGVATPVWAGSVPLAAAAGRPTGAGGDPVSAVMPGAGGGPVSAVMPGAGGGPVSAVMPGAGGGPVSAVMPGAGGGPVSAVMPGAGGAPVSAVMPGAGGAPVSAVMPGAGGAPGISGTSGAGGTPANDASQPPSSSQSTSSGDPGWSGSAGSNPGTSNRSAGTPNGVAGTSSSGAGAGLATATPNGTPDDGGSTNAPGTDQSAGGGSVPSVSTRPGQNGGTPGAADETPGMPWSTGSMPPPPPASGTDGAGEGSNPEPSAAPNESNATSQNIWQVEISGCTSNCQGTTQIQSAEQQNTTVQVLQGTAVVPAAAGAQTGSAATSQSTANLTHLQLGCVTDCFGSTSTMSAAISTAALDALQQVLSALGTIGSQSQKLGQGTEQNTVSESISQWQNGAVVQSQIASQSNVTAQVTGVTRSVTSELQAALAPSMPAVAGASNATEQGIWQVQVGCIIFCSGTMQSQRADQSNTTVQGVGAGAASAVQAGAEAVNIATQLIWQLQVGCLFWCYDTVQIQSAASSNNTLQVVGTAPPSPGAPPPPPPAPGQATGDGSAGPPDTSSGSPGAPGLGDAAGGAGLVADPGTPASAGGSSSGSGNPVAGGGSATPLAGGSSGIPGSAGPVSGVVSAESFVSNVVGEPSSAPLAGARGSDAHTLPPPSLPGGVVEATNQVVDATGTPHSAAVGTAVIATSPTALQPVRRSMVQTAAGGRGRQAAFNLPRLSMSFPATTGTVLTHDRTALSPAEIALLAMLGIVLVGFACLRGDPCR